MRPENIFTSWKKEMICNLLSFGLIFNCSIYLSLNRCIFLSLTLFRSDCCHSSDADGWGLSFLFHRIRTLRMELIKKEESTRYPLSLLLPICNLNWYNPLRHKYIHKTKCIPHFECGVIKKTGHKLNVYVQQCVQ